MTKKKEESLFDNGFFEFLKVEEEYEIHGEKRIVTRNMVRRPPGIRAIILDTEKQQILLSKEFRYELESFDYRLPGGKVFDDLQSYKEALQSGDVEEAVMQAVFKEVKEEVGIIVSNPKPLCVSPDGAGVVWDLFYFLITDYQIIENGQELEENEIVDDFVWKSFDEIIDMCIDGQIKEARTVGVLLSCILKEQRKVGLLKR